MKLGSIKQLIKYNLLLRLFPHKTGTLMLCFNGSILKKYLPQHNRAKKKETRYMVTNSRNSVYYSYWVEIEGIWFIANHHFLLKAINWYLFIPQIRLSTCKVLRQNQVSRWGRALTWGGGGVVQKRESPEFRSLEDGISVLFLFTWELHTPVQIHFVFLTLKITLLFSCIFKPI